MDRGQFWLDVSLGMKDDKGNSSLVGSGTSNCFERSLSYGGIGLRWRKLASIPGGILGAFGDCSPSAVCQLETCVPICLLTPQQ